MASKCPILTEAQIKTLVVDDKWMAHLAVCVQGRLDRVSQALTGRIRELAERYVTPLHRGLLRRGDDAGGAGGGTP